MGLNGRVEHWRRGAGGVRGRGGGVSVFAVATTATFTTHSHFTLSCLTTREAPEVPEVLQYPLLARHCFGTPLNACARCLTDPRRNPRASSAAASDAQTDPLPSDQPFSSSLR